MLHSRRDFLHMASVATLAAGLRRGTAPGALPALDLYPHAGDPALKELAAAALDAAKAAGAAYADVRLTLIRQVDAGLSAPVPGKYGVSEREEAAIGVRAFANGAWGFAASEVWTKDEAARLGRMAAEGAAIHAAGRKKKLELGDRPQVVTGEWVAPIKIDPFTVPVVEKLDVLAGHWDAAGRLFPQDKMVGGGIGVRHRRQEKTFASTDGSFVSQTLFYAHPSFGLGSLPPLRPWTNRTFDGLQPTGQGWEIMTDGTIERELEQTAEEAIMQITAERIQPNRYDVVFDAYTVGQILARTVGIAAELDRVLGYEANSGGTSYLSPVEDTLGTFNYGTPLLNVSGNRSRPQAMGTVKWDDDGVAPEEYQIIKDGALVDYHTTRDLVSPMAAWYGKNGKPMRSHGCASAQSAANVTILQSPNLEMAPDANKDTSFEDLVASLENGLVIFGGTKGPAYSLESTNTNTPVNVDRQQLNGEVDANFAYEVKNGKRTRVVYGVECLFRAPELWKSLQAIGGKSSQRTSGCIMTKGQPLQELSFGVTSVPARFKQVAVTDRWRKA